MQDALAHLRANDPIIAVLIERYAAPTFTTHTNYYQELVSSIISQQLSVKAARTIETRFKNLFDGVIPTPEQILTKSIEELRAVGLSRPKAGYMQDLASKVIDGTVDFSTITELRNEDILRELTKVKGIGEWTVHMFLMFSMGRLNVLPAGDLGIRNGVGKLYHFQSVPTPEEVRLIAQKNNWQPFASVASYYIWQSLDNSPSAA